MNDFKKGLLVGIVIMSSIFLFIASTSPKMGSNDRREIVDYHLVRGWDEKDLNKSVVNYINFKHYEPYGSPFIGYQAVGLYQAVVKYKED